MAHKKSCCVLLAGVLALTGVSSAALAEDPVCENVVLDAFSLDVLGRLSHFDFDGQTLTFVRNNVLYTFEMELFDSQGAFLNEESIANHYCGENDQFECKLIEYGNTYGIQVARKNQSAYARRADSDSNFTVMVGDGAALAAAAARDNLAMAF